MQDSGSEIANQIHRGCFKFVKIPKLKFESQLTINPCDKAWCYSQSERALYGNIMTIRDYLLFLLIV